MCKKLLQIFYAGLRWSIIIVLLLVLTLIISAWPCFENLNWIFEFRGQAWTIDKEIVVHAITLTALVLGLWRIIATHKQIRLFTETEELANMPSIMEKINEELPSAKKQVLFMANVAAIGATGAPQDFDYFRKIFSEICRRLQDNVHVIYVDPDKDTKNTGLRRFYADRHIPTNKIEEIIEKSKWLHRLLHEAAVSCYVKDTTDKIKMPHFILIDPHSTKGKAVIWNLDKTYRDENSGKVSGVGFYTRNISIINTHQHIFADAKGD